METLLQLAILFWPKLGRVRSHSPTSLLERCVSLKISGGRKTPHPVLHLVALIKGVLGLASGFVLLSAHGVRGAGRDQR